MAWRTARSIPVLHRQLRPLAPNAPPSAFGTIGDTAHSSTSDHAPKDFPGWGNDIVTAADFPKAGHLNPRTVLDAIRRSRDDRVKYGISNGQMFSSYPAHGYAPWTWRPYGGSDGHWTHGHLSVVGDARADNTRPWMIAVATESSTLPAPKPQQPRRPKMLMGQITGDPNVWMGDGFRRRAVNKATFDALVAAGVPYVPPVPDAAALDALLGTVDAGAAPVEVLDYQRLAAALLAEIAAK